MLPAGLVATVMTGLGATVTTITFKVASGATSTDSDSGNVIQPTQDVTIDVVLNPSERVGERLFPGRNREEIPFDGRVVDDSTSYQFPTSVLKAGVIVGACTWESKAGQIQIRIVDDDDLGIGQRFFALFTPG